MKSIFNLSFSLFASITLFGQNVTIPDANFKANLVGNSTLNTNADTEIQVSEAQAFTGAILCESWSISDLTGIEAFTSLTELNCTDNSLTTIDLTANTMLTSLTCATNQLTNLNISANILLTNLNCTDNLLTGLDVTTNTALTYLSIYTNSITSVDLSQNSALTNLWCMFNPLTALDVSQNSNLIFLQANNCSLTSVNLANGNNTNFVAAVLNNNSNLTCIQVDDEAYSAANWTSSDFNKDAGASYSESCAGTAALSNIEQNEIRIYPNPVQDLLNISLSEASSIVITDINGKQLLTSESNTVHQLNASNLHSGIYFITTTNGATNRFIKN